MSARDDGGPAFAPFGAPDPSDDTKAVYGMTLRDWFAGQALAGILARRAGLPDASEDAYRYADALLAERSK